MGSYEIFELVCIVVYPQIPVKFMEYPESTEN